MTVYGQGVRSAAADMSKRARPRAVACALNPVLRREKMARDVSRKMGRVLLDMGKDRGHTTGETKVAAASAVVDSGRAKPGGHEGRDSVKSPLDSWCRKYRECGAGRRQ